MHDETVDMDARILRLLAENNPEAATLMYKAHYRVLVRSVRRIIGDRDDAKDIVLELLQAVWEKRNTLKITAPIRRYLLAAAYNRSINFLRNRRRSMERLEEMRSSLQRIHIGYADLHLEADELSKLIKAAIRMLPQNAQQTFILSRHFGMTYKEMAAHFKVSEKTIEKNMTTALRLLRRFLAAYL